MPRKLELGMTMPPVSTSDEAVAFINRVGLCAWRRVGVLPDGFPSLEAQTPWDGDTGAMMENTWFWKDDLHIEKRVFYGQMLLAAGVPIFASLDFLPFLIAAQGDCDPRDLYEKNQLSHVALTLVEFLETHGPTPKSKLPYPANTSQTPPLIALQQKFLITKHSLTGRTRGTYGYVWGLCLPFFPDAFHAAAQISVPDARARVVAQLRENGLPDVTEKDAAKWLRWSPVP